MRCTNTDQTLMDFTLKKLQRLLDVFISGVLTSKLLNLPERDIGTTLRVKMSFSASYRGRAGNSFCWRSRRCRRCQRAGWEQLRRPTAADPGAAWGRSPAGQGSPVSGRSDCRTRWLLSFLIGRGWHLFHWRLFGKQRDTFKIQSELYF